MLDVYIYDADISRHTTVQSYCFRFFMKRGLTSEIKCITADAMEAGRIFSEEEKQAVFIISCDEHSDFLIKSMRKGNAENYLIIVANDFSDILTYLKPGHKPSGFILRPMAPYDIEKLMGDIISDYESKKGKTAFDCFVFKMKSTEYSIPFDSIISFESGNKKIKLKTTEKEYSFYSTFDDIQNTLPDGFIRVHKSYIINMAHIKEIHYADSEIILSGGTSVYFSRTYRSIVRELFNINAETVS